MNMTFEGMETETRNQGDDSVIRDEVISNHYLSVTPITDIPSSIPHHLPQHFNELNICVVMSCCVHALLFATQRKARRQTCRLECRSSKTNDAGNRQNMYAEPSATKSNASHNRIAIQQSIKKKRKRQEAAPAPEVQQCRPQLNEGAAKPNPNVGTKRRKSELCQKLALLMRRVPDVPTELSEREVGGRAKAPPSRQRLGIALNAETRCRCENVSAQHTDQTARRTNGSNLASLYRSSKQRFNMQEIAKVAASERREPTIEPEPATAAPTDKK